jgi:hypothetical protein
MAETIDFEQVAREILEHLSTSVLTQEAAFGTEPRRAQRHTDLIAEHLRLIWNARGAADLEALEAVMLSLMGATASAPYLKNLDRALRKLDQAASQSGQHIVTYAIDGPIVEVTAQGAYTTEEIASTFAAVKADSRLPARPLLLIGFHESQADPSYADFRSRWTLIQDLEPRRIAFVVAAVAQERLAHLYQGHGAEIGGAPPIAVFVELQAAREWLKSPE